MGSCRIRSSCHTPWINDELQKCIAYEYIIYIYCGVNNILLIFTLQVASYISCLWENENAFQTIGQATRKRGDDVINCQSSRLPTQKTMGAARNLQLVPLIFHLHFPAVFFYSWIPGYPNIVGVNVIVEISGF